MNWPLCRILFYHIIKLSDKMINNHVLCITFFTFLLIYDQNCPTIEIVRINDPQFGLQGPYNTSIIKTKDDYKKLIDIKDFTFTKNPNPCKKYPEGFLLLVIVPSNPKNFEKRMLIRNTWGKIVDSTLLVFLLGDPKNDTISLRIHHESIAHGDIVQGTFKDAYRNMTYKHVMGLKWVAHHCPKAKYILKTDDDVVVHVMEMRRFLAKELSPWGARGLIACPVLKHAIVQRDERSKWKVTDDEYGSYYFPTYCAGWAVLYSPDVVTRLLEAAQESPYFWIDDVHITGLMAQKIGVLRTSINSLILSTRMVHVLKTLGPKYSGSFLFGPQDLSRDQMLSIWKSIPK